MSMCGTIYPHDGVRALLSLPRGKACRDMDADQPRLSERGRKREICGGGGGWRRVLGGLAKWGELEGV